MKNDQLSRYKQAIDQELALVRNEILKRYKRVHGDYSHDALAAFFEVATRGGKRLRGALAIHAYTMFGGADAAMIVRAAAYLEIVFSYLLVIDDIADKSPTRRGGPTAHILMSHYHEHQKLQGNGDHFGVSQAINAALNALHEALAGIGSLPGSDSLKLKAITSLNRLLSVTCAGQMNDMHLQAVGQASEQEVVAMMEAKTAHYTFVSPVNFGMHLAGADMKDHPWLQQYCLSQGLSFQINDDIIGMFGDPDKTGKSSTDDLAEGKITLLVARTQQVAPPADVEVLRSLLGKNHINDAELKMAQTIMSDCGALRYVQDKAAHYKQQSLKQLDNAPPQLQAGCDFLRQLALVLDARQT